MTKNNLYEDVRFQAFPSRPFFYSDFVATIDGKIQVKKDGYWPLGSKNDYATFTFLRAHADIIIDGRNTALQFGKKTIETIHSKEFLATRQSLGKTKQIQYGIVTHHANEELCDALANVYNFKPTIFTSKQTTLDTKLHKQFNVISLTQEINVKHLATSLFAQGFRTVFIDGGPTLLRQFLDVNLLDELFVTIAPKIVGTSKETLTMVGGGLFTPNEIKQFELLSATPVENEIYIRYRLKTT